MDKDKYKDLSKEELLKIIQEQEKELKDPKKYGLFWDKEKVVEKVVVDCENNLPVLERVKNKEIRTNDSEDNILIEGDNYHALNVLNYTHRNEVDLIYIDPPYNTGNKDFVYNDSFVEFDDTYKHSKWLNFMDKRLKLTKKLLKKDGALFCSISDKEYPRIIMLLESIFGEQNIKTICVKMSESTGVKMASVIKNGSIPKLKEYLVIAKKDGIKNLFLEKIAKEKWDNEYKTIITNVSEEEVINIKEIRDNECRSDEEIEKCNQLMGGWKHCSLTKYFSKNNILKKNQEDFKYKNSWRIFRTVATADNVKKITDKQRELVSGDFFCIVTPKKKLYWMLKDYNKLQLQPRIKILLADDYLTQHIGDFWSDIKTTGLDNEGGVIFKNGKKPLKLLERIIKTNNNNNITILDFFAGSGTTAEAVLRLNKKDNGTRKFILCTYNEEDGTQIKIAEDYCYPRIKNAIKGLKDKKGLSGNLQYFKTNFVKNTSNRDQLKINLTKKCTEILCVKENIFNLTKKKGSYKIFTSNNKSRHLCIFYNFIDKTFDEFIKEVGKLKGKKSVYIFALNNRIDKTKFKGIDDVLFEAIPQKILEVYEQLVKISKK